MIYMHMYMNYKEIMKVLSLAINPKKQFNLGLHITQSQ